MTKNPFDELLPAQPITPPAEEEKSVPAPTEDEPKPFTPIPFSEIPGIRTPEGKPE